jgi:cathepsin B
MMHTSKVHTRRKMAPKKAAPRKAAATRHGGLLWLLLLLGAAETAEAPCPVIDVAGTPPAGAPKVMGLFALQPGNTTGGHPAYFSTVMGEWLWFDLQFSMWGIGNSLGENRFFLRVYDTAQAPGAIAATWQGWNGSAWNEAPSVKASCVSTFDAELTWPLCKTPVLDQGVCGSCWSFGSTQSVSNRILSHGGIAAVALEARGSTLSAETPVALFDLGGCNGGYPIESIKKIADQGVPAASCIHYLPDTYGCWEHNDTAGNGCTTGDDIKVGTCYSNSSSRYMTWGTEDGVSNSYIDSSSIRYLDDANEIASDLFENGPIAVAFDIHQNFLDHFAACWKNGSAAPPCPIYSSTIEGNTTLTGSHIVLIVGWGSEGGQPYWRVRNSWGKTWGDDGYFRISKGVNLAGIEDYAVAFDIIGSTGRNPVSHTNTNAAGAGPTGTRVKPGGWLEQPLGVPIVKEALLAIESHHPSVNGCTIISAYTQVVAGINVRLVFENLTLVLHKSLESLHTNGGFKIVHQHT